MSSTTTSLTLVLMMAMPWEKTSPFADWPEATVLRSTPTSNHPPRIMDRLPGREGLAIV